MAWWKQGRPLSRPALSSSSRTPAPGAGPPGVGVGGSTSPPRSHAGRRPAPKAWFPFARAASRRRLPPTPPRGLDGLPHPVLEVPSSSSAPGLGMLPMLPSAGAKLPSGRQTAWPLACRARSWPHIWPRRWASAPSSHSASSPQELMLGQAQLLAPLPPL